MKLEQNQVWQNGDEYFRIVHLERLEVQYKLVLGAPMGPGSHHHVSKKEFCRLIKSATLVTPADSKKES